MSKPVKIFEVLYHDDTRPYGGAMGDGSFIERFKGTQAGQKAAETFAKGRSYYGHPAEAKPAEVSKSVAQRYGLA